MIVAVVVTTTGNSHSLFCLSLSLCLSYGLLLCLLSVSLGSPLVSLCVGASAVRSLRLSCRSSVSMRSLPSPSPMFPCQSASRCCVFAFPFRPVCVVLLSVLCSCPVCVLRVCVLCRRVLCAVLCLRVLVRCVRCVRCRAADWCCCVVLCSAAFPNANHEFSAFGW